MLTDLLFIYNLENTVQTDHEVKKVLDRIGLEKYHARFAQEEISYMKFLAEEQGLDKCFEFFNYAMGLKSQFLNVLVLYHSYKNEFDIVRLSVFLFS